MTVETFDNYLKFVEKDNCKFLKEKATLLRDNKTYLIPEDVWNEELSELFDDKRGGVNIYRDHKCLVLTDGNNHVVGGVLFYGRFDIQIQVFDEYKGKGYMSEIHKNGILNENLYKNQICSIELGAIEDQNDLDMKLHLLSYIDVSINNLATLERWFDISKVAERNKYIDRW